MPAWPVTRFMISHLAPRDRSEPIWPAPAQTGWGIVILVLLGAGAFCVDLPLAYQLLHRRVLDFIHRPLQVAEPFGDAAGVIVIAVSIAVLDPQGRRKAWFVLGGGLAGGLAANLPKLLVSRVRPSRLDFEVVTSSWQTFDGWLQWGAGGSGYQSFPSAHTASAVALALVLTRIYPQGRVFFLIMAGMVAFQRVETGAHFLSDTLFGAAVGLAIGSLILRVERWQFAPLSRSLSACDLTESPLQGSLPSH